MATENELAVFSYNSYRPSRRNFISLEGWEINDALSRPDRGSGFDGSVFVSQSQSHGGSSEIVIAFRGTDADSVPTAAADWLRGNVPAAGGYSSAQVRRAIEMVADVMAAYPGARITLTGHSLGGGLASLMAAFFDLEAVVFDPAPFEYSAIDLRYIPAAPPLTNSPTLIPTDLVAAYFGHYEQYQFERGGVPAISSAFQQYRTTLATGSAEQIAALFRQRESRVTGTYVEGEILAPIRQLLPTIIDPAGLTSIPIGNTTLNDAPLGSAESIADGISLHSALLMAALRISPDLATASQGHPALLELLLDGRLYATKNDAPVTGFLNRLLTEQLRAGVGPGQGMLDRFAQDVMRLGIDGTTNHSAIRDALLATVIEYYRFATPADTTPFVQLTDDAISFDMSRLPQGSGTQDGSSLRVGRRRLLAGLEALAASPATARLRAAADAASTWTIQTGTGGLTTLGGITNEVQIGSESQANTLQGAAGNDLLINGNAGGVLRGGADNDTLIGGSGADTLYGGDGVDYLSGGNEGDFLYGDAGNDELNGGIGDDRYYFSTDGGSDTVFDSDGVGAIVVNGVTVAIGQRLAENTWKSADGQLTVQRQRIVSPMNLFNLAIRDSAGHTLATIINWQPGQLGLALEGAYATAGQTAGDVIPFAGGGGSGQSAQLMRHNTRARRWRDSYVDSYAAGGLRAFRINETLLAEGDWPPAWNTSGTGLARGYLNLDNLRGSNTGNDRIFGGSLS